MKTTTWLIWAAALSLTMWLQAHLKLTTEGRVIVHVTGLILAAYFGASAQRDERKTDVLEIRATDREWRGDVLDQR